MSDKRFPIQGDYYHDYNKAMRRSGSTWVSWELAEEAYEAYSSRYGTSQSLERLAELGGFGRDEFAELLSKCWTKRKNRRI